MSEEQLSTANTHAFSKISDAVTHRMEKRCDSGRREMEAVEALRVLNNVTGDNKCSMHNQVIMTQNEDQFTPNGKGEAFLLMVGLTSLIRFY